MNSKRFLMAGVLAVSLAAQIRAEPNADLQTRLERAEARIAELERAEQDTWLNERRAEEVKALVREVMADADARASLLVGGGTAGHNGKNFFLANADGSFLMKIGGQLQIRHNWNFRQRESNDLAAVPDADERGFEIPRAKVWFEGNIASPRLHYALQLVGDRDDNSVDFEKILISYDLMDNLNVWIGEAKAPFLREELVESYHQMVIDRSLVNQVFTAGRVQGIGFDWWVDRDTTNRLRLRMSINDGFRSAEPGTFPGSLTGDSSLHVQQTSGAVIVPTRNNKAFDQDSTDFALTGRLDSRVFGDWSQGDDFQAWSGEDTSLIIGAAVHWEVGETGNAQGNGHFLTWTVDSSYERMGFTYFGAFNMADVDWSTVGSNRHHYGLTAQVGYQIIPDKLEPYFRYEYLKLSNPSGPSQNGINLYTLGFNYFIARNNAKFTTDFVYAGDAIPTAASMGLSGNDLSLTGLLFDDASNRQQVVWRMQFQLLF